MSNQFFEELSAQMIESSRWENIPEWVIWSIEFITSRKLVWVKSNIHQKLLKEAIIKAKKSEEYILKYLEINTYNEKEIADFSLNFPLWKKELKDQSHFYNHLLNLYFLRNPDINSDSIQWWINEKKEFKIEFWANKEKGEYFIRRITLWESTHSKQ